MSHSPEGKCSVFHRKGPAGLSFLVGWSNLRLSQQPLPELAQTCWAQGQGQLKEAPSEEEVGEQPPGTRPARAEQAPRVQSLPAAEWHQLLLPWEPGNEHREGSDLCQEEARAVLSAGLGIAPGPLRGSAVLVFLGWQLRPIPAWELRRSSPVQDLTREHSSPGTWNED